MSQKPTIGAFRARLRNSGYTDISIKRLKFFNTELNKQNLFVVTAKEPLCNVEVKRIMSYPMDFYLWH